MELSSEVINKVNILRINGRFDSNNASQVRNWFETIIGAEQVGIVVNLGGVGFIDSTGLSTLVQGMKRARQVSGDLLLCGLQQPVRMVFELTRLDKVFDIYVSEADALRAFSH